MSENTMRNIFFLAIVNLEPKDSRDFMVGITWIASCNTQPPVSKIFLKILVSKKQTFCMKSQQFSICIFGVHILKPLLFTPKARIIIESNATFFHCQSTLTPSIILIICPPYFVLSLSFECRMGMLHQLCDIRLLVNNYDVCFLFQFMVGLNREIP